MSPRLGVVSVVGAVIVVLGSVAIVSRLVAPPTKYLDQFLFLENVSLLVPCSAASQSCSDQKSLLCCQNANTKTYGYWAEENGLGEM